MRIVHMTAAALLGLAAASGLRLIYGTGEGEARAAPLVAVPDAGPGAYRLTVDGRQGDCLLWQGRRIDDVTRSLDLSDACGRIGAALDGASLWIDHGHGDVVIADETGEALVEFGASDGAAFESFRPLAPMMTLTALR